MANKAITALTAASTLAGTEVVPVVQSSTTKKATITQILAAAQPLDSDLTAIAALSTTAFGRALLALADAAALRTAGGLGTISTQDASAAAITGGTVTGITDLAVADGGTGASTAVAAASNLGGAASTLATLDANVFVPQAQLPVRLGAWVKTSAVAESVVPRWAAGIACALSSGRMQIVGVEYNKGTVVTRLGFATHSTALSAGTHQWGVLLDSALAKIKTTNDEIATAWAAQSEKQFTLSSVVTDATITSGAAVVGSATAAFSAAHVGQRVSFVGAGAAGAVLGTDATPVTILSVAGDGLTATLSANAGTTVASGGTLYIGVPYTIPTSGRYYHGLVVTGGAPSLCGHTNPTGHGADAAAPILFGIGNTGLTDPASCPNPPTLAGGNGFYSWAT